ncbi:S8 family peptidase [Novilysobacter erysipheiresistens]|uniref:S8 family peptidase n=1 Tax=Novilysobacter erysipheiresistens TaxID=1749332 RepID=A0ABU7Z1I5_9GAMM
MSIQIIRAHKRRPVFRNHLPGILAAAVLLGLSAPLAMAGNSTPLPVADATSALAADRQEHDRFIVRYREGSPQRHDTQRLVQSLQQVVARSGLVGGAGLSVRHVRSLALGGDVVEVSRPLDRVSAAALMRSIATDPAVAHVEPDILLSHTGLPARVSPAMVPDDELYAQYQWHLHSATGGIRAPAAWDATSGEGVVVAVLDTGITDHEDLDGNVLEGYDFITDTFLSRRETDERVAGAHDYGDWNDDPTQCPVSPSSFHGSHVAGTVAETTGNGIGMAGVAHDARVLPVRVLGRCGGYLSDIADAVVWASGGSVDGVPDNANPAEVINMSLSGAAACGAESTMQLAIDAAIANGTTVVVAAGNDNADVGGFTPASCASVVTVGATRIGGGRAGYSNYGSRVDLSGPGGGGSADGNPGGYVWQSINDSATSPELGTPTYGGMAGTSMAAPHVAGVVALVQSVAETPLAPDEMRALLKDTARPFPVEIPAGTPVGSGILDAQAAVAAVAEPCEGDECEPVPEATPISNRVPVTGLAGGVDEAQLFSIEVPAGASGLSFISYGGSGDVSLLVSFGAEPTQDAADFSSARPGNNETIRIATPQVGTYYVKVVGVKAFAAVTLQARHN